MFGESFSNYQTELKWLTTNQSRIKFIAKTVDEISNTGNTVILVDRIETGEMIQKLIPGSIFISGKVKSKDRKEEYKEMQEVDGKVIIATYGVLSTRHQYCKNLQSIPVRSRNLICKMYPEYRSRTSCSTRQRLCEYI